MIAIAMKRAKTLLKNGNMTVENISHAVGYQNVENFSRQFKKEFSDDTGAVPQPEPCFLNLLKILGFHGKTEKMWQIRDGKKLNRGGVKSWQEKERRKKVLSYSSLC